MRLRPAAEKPLGNIARDQEQHRRRDRRKGPVEGNIAAAMGIEREDRLDEALWECRTLLHNLKKVLPGLERAFLHTRRGGRGLRRLRPADHDNGGAVAAGLIDQLFNRRRIALRAALRPALRRLREGGRADQQRDQQTQDQRPNRIPHEHHPTPHKPAPEYPLSTLFSN